MNESQFSVVPLEVIQDKRLTLEQTRVLIALFSFRNKVTNTVWPSRASIAERTGMHPSNISSATTALVALGWLAKDGLGGHSKATRYTLCSPDLEPKKVVQPAAPTVAERATVAQSATVAERATVAASATQTVAQSATPPLADQATRKEVSIEVSIEQSNGVTRKRATAPRQAAASVVKPEGVEQQIWDDFVAVRKSKRAALTATALAGIEREAHKAGLTLDAALAVCCENGWAGFKAEWYANSHATAARATAPAETAYQRSMRERMQEAVPAIARKAPGAQPMQAVEFFNTVEAAPARRIGVSQ